MAPSIQSIFDTLLNDTWFELTFLLVVALGVAFIFARFGQPKVIAYIVVGVVIGPSVLNIIRVEGGSSGLPASIQILAELGSLFLLLMVGLDSNLKEIYTRKSIMIALGGVVVPWTVGYGVATAFGFGAEAIFIGTTLVATSVAVTASIISEFGMIGTPVAKAIVGAAVVDDILGMVVLGVTNGVTSGGLDIVGVILLVVAAIIFVVVGAWIGTRFLTRLVFNVQIEGYRRKMPLSGFVLMLAITSLYAFVAEFIGISLIVGAFVAGACFSGSALRDGFKKGTQYFEALFVPLFFVSLGTVVDIGDVNTIVFDSPRRGGLRHQLAGCGVRAHRDEQMGFGAVGIGMAPRLASPSRTTACPGYRLRDLLGGRVHGTGHCPAHSQRVQVGAEARRAQPYGRLRSQFVAATISRWPLAPLAAWSPCCCSGPLQPIAMRNALPKATADSVCPVSSSCRNALPTSNANSLSDFIVPYPH
jgi:Kef-type K+ transport system membrane component KefB